MVDLNLSATISDTGTTGVTWTTPAAACDGNSATAASFGNGVFGPATYILRADYGAPVTIHAYDLVGVSADINAPAPGYWTVDSSSDGTTWTAVPHTASVVVGGLSMHYAFTADVTARYFRVRGSYAGFGFQVGRHVASWIATEGTPPDPEPPEPEPEPYVAPPPGRFLLEIYASNPDAYRWGVAHWGEDAWAAAGWQDVTPEGVVALVQWGVGNPDAGYLATADAGAWQVTTWDPDRILDPANADGPYYRDLVPGLPVRINHATYTVRTGVLESATFDYATRTGVLRVTDGQSILANASVPASSVSILPDDVIGRDRAAIAAAGAAVSVRYATHSPTIAPMPEGDYTAWQVILAAARQVLWLPYIDRRGEVNHFSWRAPEDRGAVIASSRMIDLASEISDDGLVSVVEVYDDADPEVLITRRITPTPRYGRRVVSIQDPMIDADAWADAVLADRSAAGLRFRPGDLWLDTFDDVQMAVSRQLGELVTITYPEAEPGLELTVRIVGVRLRVEHRGIHDAPTWEIAFATYTTGVEPLAADGVGPPVDYLIDDDTGELLYPNGSVVIA